jgi:predicted PurR-regulated permease PerM
MVQTRSRIGGWPLTAAIAVVLLFLFFVREILLPFILAAAIAFILTPVVDSLTARSKIPRWTVATAVYLCVVTIFALLGYWVGGLLIKDATQIVRQFPQLLEKLLSDISNLISGVSADTMDVDAVAQAVTADLGALFSGEQGVKLASYGVTALVNSILMLVLLIYFLISGRQVAGGVFWLVPPEYRPEADRVVCRVLPMLWRYFVGLVGVISYTTLTAWLGFRFVFHLPHAPVLAVAVGLLELIPVIGPAISLALVGLTAIQQTSILGIAGLAVFAIALRLSIDQIVGPLVLGHAAQLHPVVIIFAFLSGASLFGIIGLLLAVPFAAGMKIAVTMYYSEPVENPPPRDGPAPVPLRR